MRMLNRIISVYAFASAMALLSLYSCCDDDREEIDLQKGTTITVGGTFTITNICTGDDLGVSNTNMFDVDTLRILFEPEEKYKNLHFIIECEELSNIDDSLFVFKNRTSSPTSLRISANCKSDDNQYTAERAIDVSVSHTYTVVPFWLQASQDLLLLSTAQVTYTDADGLEHTFDIKDEDWVRPDSVTMYIFQDNKGFEQVANDKEEGLEKGWTLVDEEKLGPNATYSFDVRYYHLGIDASVTVRYKRKDTVDATADSYYLYHTIDRKSAKITIPGSVVIDSYSHISIDLTDHNVSSSALDDYFSNIQSNPDMFKLNISERGTITKIQ